MLEAVAAALPEVFRVGKMDCGLILGSGWGEALAPDEVLARVPYAELAGYGESTVVGHRGELLLLVLRGRRVA